MANRRDILRMFALVFIGLTLPARALQEVPWLVEQMPGGTVSQNGNCLEIRDKAGCTVWYTRELMAPITISYDAMVVNHEKPGERTSDLNCFWMATDPSHPRDFMAAHPRSGKFSDYDSLKTYYVGFGGNDNTTTRFRRYPGDGTRPLLPQHDLRSAEFLLQPNRWYRIEVSAIDGAATYRVDGNTIFSYRDKQFLSRGWFGFRTVGAHIKIRGFAVHHGAQP